MENKIINLENSNYFYRQYETISIDEKNKKKPYVLTNLIKKRGKLVAESVNVSSKDMAEIIKETPGTFFSLPKEVFEDYFMRREEHIISDKPSDLETFLKSVKEGMFETVEKTDGDLEKLGADIDAFNEKILEKIDAEKLNIAKRLAVKEKIKDIVIE